MEEKDVVQIFRPKELDSRIYYNFVKLFHITISKIQAISKHIISQAFGLLFVAFLDFLIIQKTHLHFLACLNSFSFSYARIIPKKSCVNND